MKQLRLALVWNRVDIAKQDIITKRNLTQVGLDIIGDL